MILIRLLRPWNGFDVGREIHLDHPGLTEELVLQGFAERIEPTAPTETLTESPAQEEAGRPVIAATGEPVAQRPCVPRARARRI